VWTEADAAKAAGDPSPPAGGHCAVRDAPPDGTFNPGQIVYTPLLGLTRMQRASEASGELYRIVRPIGRLDEDRNAYDLTRAFIEEALFFPFAPHDDLIDACSRIYDMQPVAAQAWERGSFAVDAYPDA
jgi:hypothetical protein